jgi:HEPN domain-containing protein
MGCWGRDVSLPDDLAEVSRTLFRKAEGDAAAARDLAGNSNIPDEIVGFHAQQAVEKWLKAVIAGVGQSFEQTHDLRRLISVATQERSELPVSVDAVIALTQYSVPLRYEDLLDVEPLDRDATVALVDEVGRWVKAQLAEVAATDGEESGKEEMA